MHGLAPPPDPPELPEGVVLRPRWPAWYAGAGFAVGLVGTLIAVGVLSVIFDVGQDDASPAFLVVATLVQNTVFLATAVFFAAKTLKPRAWHFGLNRAPFWPAVGWAALGLFSFYLVAAVYGALVQPDVDQGVTEDLGAKDSTLGLIAAGFMVIAVAPVAEEIFFRGFFYRALRSRFTIAGSAVIDGLLFGIIHWDFTGAEALLIVPPLALLGTVFCLVYEKTGSLFPVIALHAFNNALAYGVQVDSSDAAVVSAVLGVTVIGACMVVPRLIRPAPGTASP